MSVGNGLKFGVMMHPDTFTIGHDAQLIFVNFAIIFICVKWAIFGFLTSKISCLLAFLLIDHAIEWAKLSRQCFQIYFHENFFYSYWNVMLLVFYYK